MQKKSYTEKQYVYKKCYKIHPIYMYIGGHIIMYITSYRCDAQLVANEMSSNSVNVANV